MADPEASARTGLTAADAAADARRDAGTLTAAAVSAEAPLAETAPAVMPQQQPEVRLREATQTVLHGIGSVWVDLHSPNCVTRTGRNATLTP